MRKTFAECLWLLLPALVVLNLWLGLGTGMCFEGGLFFVTAKDESHIEYLDDYRKNVYLEYHSICFLI